MGTQGVESQDMLRVGSLSIVDYLFEEALTVGGGAWPNWLAPLSVLGLSRVPYHTEWSDLSSLNPCQRMMTDNVRDRALFSLQLPKSEQEVGLLLLGAVNANYTQGVTAVLAIPDALSDHNIANEAINGGWQVYTRHARYGDDVSSDSSRRGAVFKVSFKEVGLPRELAGSIRAKIGYKLLDVPCSRQYQLPDFVIGLGTGDQTLDFILSSWECIREDQSSIYGHGCRTMFVDLEEEEEDNLILLGSYFIDGFYHVFDAGSKTISLVEYTN